MAKIVSNPNPYSKTLSDSFYRKIFVLISAVTGMALAFYMSKNTNAWLVVVAYIVLIFFLASYYKILKNIGRNDRGSLAESKVKNVLSELPDSYTIFKNVLIKEGLDIDLIVVGPTGIFVIEVKSHRRLSYFYRQRFINQTFKETMLLKKYLESHQIKTFVYPVLAFTRAQVQHEAKKGGVCITRVENLLTLIAHGNFPYFNKDRAEAAISSLNKH